MNSPSPAEVPQASGRIVAGVMAGTSADGIDVALVRIAPDWGWELLGFRHSGFTRRERQAVLAAASGQTPVSELALLHVWLGRRIGAAVREACAAAGIAAVTGADSGEGLALVASHGQTVFHQGRAASLQIGAPAMIAAVAGAPVVSDFRSADIAQGGEGAPLVPWADWRLFQHPRRYRVALNLGGIANITLLPPGKKPNRVEGFDTGPGNMACDALMRALTGGRQSFDRDGRLAQSGAVEERLLRQWMRHPFLRRPPPKSAGREQFGEPYVLELRRRAGRISPANLMATLAALTARSVALGIRRGGAAALEAEVIVAGGGVHNRAIMAALAQELPHCRWRRSDDLGVPAQAREALAFALLGEAYLRGEPANLPRVTGAVRAVVLGSYTPFTS